MNNLNNKIKKIKPITIAILAVVILDFLTTAIVLSSGGIELNPIVNILGWPLVILIRGCCTIWLAWIIQHIKYTNIFWIIVLFWSVAPVWNLGQIMFH